MPLSYVYMQQERIVFSAMEPSGCSGVRLVVPSSCNGVIRDVH